MKCATVWVLVLLIAGLSAVGCGDDDSDAGPGFTQYDSGTDSDTDVDTDSDSDTDTDTECECTCCVLADHSCMSELLCEQAGGTVHDEYTCCDEYDVCCEIGSDTDTTSDTGTSSDTETSSDTGSDSESDTASDTSSDTASDTDTGSALEPEIVSLGDADKILLQGVVITPSEAFEGEVLIVDDLLTCVAADCSSETDADSASVVQTHGIIAPGMIDTHNHILYNIFDEDDWAPASVYTNHNQWTAEAKYGALVDAKQYLNSEGDSPINVNCEMIKYGEIKALIAGTTSVAGAANPANKICYRTLARTIDQTANGLCGTVPPQSCPDFIQVNVIFPFTSSADAVCANFLDGDTHAYLIHLGEGVDATALDEFEDLYTVTTTDGCLYDPKTAIVHGTAFGATEFSTMATNGMGLSWSPASNVFLYGGGTDLTKTTDIPAALTAGIAVAVSPDWSIGGSQNLLDELRYADLVDNTEWSDTLSPEDLVQMATSNAAELLALEDQIGSLAVGMKADVMVVSGDQDAPYDAILAATPAEVALTIVDGKVLYGDDQLEPLAPSDPGCEAMDICGEDKFLCVAIAGGDSTNKFGQTFAEIETALSIELAAYDALDLSEWDFWPLTPIVGCE